MRKVVAYELLSLNGVAEAPDEFFTDWDDAMEANLGAVIATHFFVGVGPSLNTDVMHTEERGPDVRRTSVGVGTMIGGWL